MFVGVGMIKEDNQFLLLTSLRERLIKTGARLVASGKRTGTEGDIPSNICLRSTSDAACRPTR